MNAEHPYRNCFPKFRSKTFHNGGSYILHYPIIFCILTDVNHVELPCIHILVFVQCVPFITTMFNQTKKQERAYLQQIINLLKKIISSTDVSVKDYVDTLAEYKDYLWSNKDIDPHEIRSMRESILNHFAIGESVIDKRKRLSKILDIPYFGRIDFQEKEKERPVIPVYIGVHTFHDSESRSTLIYDWRAPISSM